MTCGWSPTSLTPPHDRKGLHFPHFLLLRILSFNRVFAILSPVCGEFLRPHQSMSSGDGGKARPQRGLTGCLTCRARKTKCDEEAGTCRKCKKRGSRCVWGDNTSLTERERKELSAMAAGSQDLTQAGLGRRRIAKSCTNCRSVRQKCSGDLPGCFRCRTKSLNCVYASSHEASSPTIQSGEGFLADRILLGGLVDAFFREIAPLRCFGFIHIVEIVKFPINDY